MLSLGIEASRAFWIAVASAALPSGSPPPSRAATVIARASLVKSLPRLASAAPFLCLIEDHFECPDIVLPFYERAGIGRELHIRRHAVRGPGAVDGDTRGLDLHRLADCLDPVPGRRALRRRRDRDPCLLYTSD